MCGTTLPSAAKAIDSAMLFARSDDRPTHGNSFENDVEDRHREIPRRQSDEADGPFSSNEVERLRKRRAETAVTSTPWAPPPVNFTISRVASAFARVNGDPRAKLPRQGELLFRNVERGDVEAHGASILHRDVPEPAYTGDREPLTGLRFGFL